MTPPHLLGEDLDGLDGAGPQAEDLLGVLVEQIPGVGGIDLLGGPYQQLDPQLPLQGGHMGADGGLGQVQRLGSPGKTALLHHAGEGLQLLDVDIHDFLLS